MKKLLITTLLAGGMAITAFGQATVFLDNEENTGVFGGAGGTPFMNDSGNPVYSTAVTQNGLIFTGDPAAQAGNLGYTSGSQLLGVDVNVTVLGGATPTTATNVIANMTGSAITGDNFDWGRLIINSDVSTLIPGTTATATVYLRLQAWEGSAASFATSTSYKGDTGVFANGSGGITSNGPISPPDLTGMPDLLLIPEPSALALSSIGAVALFLFRRNK